MEATKTRRVIDAELETLSSHVQQMDQSDDARVSRISLIHSTVEDLLVEELLGRNVGKEMKLLRTELQELESVPDKRRAFRRQIQLREVERTRAVKQEAKKELAEVVSANLGRIEELEAAFIDAGKKLLAELPTLNQIYSLSGRANEHYPGRTPRKVLADTVNVVFFPELRTFNIQKPRDEKPVSSYLKRFEK